MNNIRHFPDHNEVNCTITHTVPNYRGECECENGWFGDKPVTERGCWQCSEKCNFLSECKYPGTCICKYGLQGPNCTAPVPTILSIRYDKRTKNGIESRFVQVKYQTNSDFIPTNAYVKIDKIILSSFINEANTITCDIPSFIDGQKMIQLSFDNISWSEANDKNKINFDSIIVNNDNVPIRTPIDNYIRTNFEQKHKQERIHLYKPTRYRIVMLSFIVFAIMLFYDMKKSNKHIPNAFLTTNEKRI